MQLRVPTATLFTTAFAVWVSLGLPQNALAHDPQASCCIDECPLLLASSRADRQRQCKEAKAKLRDLRRTRRDGYRGSAEARLDAREARLRSILRACRKPQVRTASG